MEMNVEFFYSSSGIVDERCCSCFAFFILSIEELLI
jgi:hypothetical protein